MALYPGGALNGLALCAGVGGLELGLHIAEPEYRTVCYVERGLYPAAVLAARMADKALSDAPVWDDVATFDGRPWRGRVSVVTGGYPCQPFSSAGRRQGADDPRHLWPHVRRIVGEIGPEWAFFENVEGHLSLGADVVVRDLQAMGYRVQAGLFSAAEVGAGHLRRRLFILAHADRQQCAGSTGYRAFAGGDPDAGTENSIRCAGLDRTGRAELDADMADPEGSGGTAGIDAGIPLFAPAPSELGRWDAVLAGRPDLQPQIFGLDDGMAHRVDRRIAAGNGVVSLAAAYAWRTLRAAMSCRGMTGR